MKYENYEELQVNESAYSRDTMWGQRAIDNVHATSLFIHGKILNIGCGDGLEMEEIIKETGCEVVGIDISAPKVEICQANGLNVVKGIMEDLPFPDKSFDCVYIAHALEHSEDLDKAISEIKRVANRAIIIVPLEEHTPNEAHTSFIPNPEYLKEKVNGTVLFEITTYETEVEYFLIVDFKEEK